MCVRLEQPYLNANASFFEALSCCHRLQRLCLISRSGTFDSSATETFMEQCCQVIMCHMFMGGTLVACRTLQKSLLDRSVKVKCYERAPICRFLLFLRWCHTSMFQISKQIIISDNYKINKYKRSLQYNYSWY